ncbi:MAG: putative tail tip assembly protein I [Prokaryotic dsDNA virus sp.]|uniref:tail assembly protein n=1 Tax=Methylophaga sp. UBA2689 TaxID=1946878 RepID=UPI00118BC706|nr:hypothetical protein [Methylophaga sp. UBA2689]QDP47071.1 MAG: putative tail tip assembly protein I [Prokaryotic dsDNA virus sp.]|tara:strand:- start:7780 stop:8364 length:585 start_codon:yes stop_codon:yes gene_type:complete
MKTVMLYGSLGSQFGRVYRFEIQSPAEAVRALCATVKGFRQALSRGEYRVIVGGKSSLELNQVVHPISDRESIRIVPVVSGSGDGFGKILVGAALIGLSLAVPGFGAFTIAGQSFSVASIAGSIGFSLVLGGVSQMLFKPPKGPDTAERPENKPSFIFNGAINTTRQGGIVPLCYGETVVGSQVISAGLSVEQL